MVYTIGSEEPTVYELQPLSPAPTTISRFCGRIVYSLASKDNVHANVLELVDDKLLVVKAEPGSSATSFSVELVVQYEGFQTATHVPFGVTIEECTLEGLVAANSLSDVTLSLLSDK